MTYLIASKMTTTPVQVHLSRVAENRSRVIVWGGGRAGHGGWEEADTIIYWSLVLSVLFPQYLITKCRRGMGEHFISSAAATQHNTNLCRQLLFVISYMKGNSQLTYN